MGELFLHDLSKYGCDVFIETGTGKGTGLSHALKYRFAELYSIEINETLFTECKQKFQSPRVELLNDTSVNGLDRILRNMYPNNRILFWLDAHFPGADFQLANYDDDIPMNTKLPLREEIAVIAKYRQGCKDVFIVDDLQLFEDGDYELKTPPEFLRKYRTSNQFIYDTFGATHAFTKDYRHQGFLILTPKQ